MDNPNNQSFVTKNRHQYQLEANHAATVKPPEPRESKILDDQKVLVSRRHSNPQGVTPKKRTSHPFNEHIAVA